MPKVTERKDASGNTIRVGDVVKWKKNGETETSEVIGTITHLGYKKVTLEV